MIFRNNKTSTQNNAVAAANKGKETKGAKLVKSDTKKTPSAIVIDPPAALPSEEKPVSPKAGNKTKDRHASGGSPKKSGRATTGKSTTSVKVSAGRQQQVTRNKPPRHYNSKTPSSYCKDARSTISHFASPRAIILLPKELDLMLRMREEGLITSPKSKSNTITHNKESKEQDNASSSCNDDGENEYCPKQEQERRVPVVVFDFGRAIRQFDSAKNSDNDNDDCDSVSVTSEFAQSLTDEHVQLCTEYKHYQIMDHDDDEETISEIAVPGPGAEAELRFISLSSSLCSAQKRSTREHDTSHLNMANDSHGRLVSSSTMIKQIASVDSVEQILDQEHGEEKPTGADEPEEQAAEEAELTSLHEECTVLFSNTKETTTRGEEEIDQTPERDAIEQEQQGDQDHHHQGNGNNGGADALADLSFISLSSLCSAQNSREVNPHVVDDITSSMKQLDFGDNSIIGNDKHGEEEEANANAAEEEENKNDNNDGHIDCASSVASSSTPSISISEDSDTDTEHDGSVSFYSEHHSSEDEGSLCGLSPSSYKSPCASRDNTA
jgi:hypothetical protein